MLTLRIRDPQFFRKRSTAAPVRTIDLEAEPCPTIMATGLRSVSCDKYWLEEGGPMRAPDPAKPPYRVPSMAEIRRTRPNGFKAISLFAGAGGSSLGYRMAGFKMLWASEFVDAAREVYALNAMPNTIVDGRDIRLVDPEGVMRALGLKRGELDVLDGSPPCASFSMAGKRDKHWGQEKKYSDRVQRTDDLFDEYVRFVRAFGPKVFVAENVSGLVKGVAKGYFLDILKALKGCGYRVQAQLLDAQWLGVPQARQRIIFVGVREDLELEPAHPTPLPYRYSVRDAISVAGIVHGNGSGHSSNRGDAVPLDRPLPTVNAGSKGSGPHQFYVEGESDISGQAIGGEWDRLNPGQQSDRYFSLVRTNENEPCPTVTAAGGMNSGIATVTHPTEKRKFAIAELKRICAFPDDFELRGSYAQQWERLGRAVPPLMMRAIAEAVRDRVLRPASARSAGRAPRSPGRSTTAKPPKGGATKRAGARRAPGTGTPAP